ncbi:MAG TPA: sugar phosphate isomerase/epimerase [Anaerolineales bacterium]|nr:sugar phosphate isomerase/epimerase [Anaerolineales bacterium]
MKPAIGLQLWSVRNNLDLDYVKTLEKIAEIGYKNIELITNVTPEGLVFGKNMRAAELRQHLDHFGLCAVSSHFVPTPDMRLESIIDDLQVLGVDTLACAIWFWSNQKEVIEFNQTFNHYAETCKKGGIQLYYHNHYHEFQVFGEQSIFEMMIEQMDKDLVMFEFDTYWAVRGGQDPIYWLKKLGTRCDLLHQKDLPAAAAPVILFERFGYDANITIDTMWETQDVEHFTEVGEGKLNIAGFIQSARKYNNARYVFIEQDMTKKTEFESIAVSLANINRILAAS